MVWFPMDFFYCYFERFRIPTRIRNFLIFLFFAPLEIQIGNLRNPQKIQCFSRRELPLITKCNSGKGWVLSSFFSTEFAQFSINNRGGVINQKTTLHNLQNHPISQKNNVDKLLQFLPTIKIESNLF